MTPRQTRASLRAELLSRMHAERRDDTLRQLEALVAAHGVNVAPEGGWVARAGDPPKDTLVIFSGADLVAAIVINVLPMLDPLVLRPGIEWPALILEFTRLRAEGILQQMGFEEYCFGIPREYNLDWHRYVSLAPSTEPMGAGGEIKFYKRPL